jgi:hypothetical protein
MTSSQFTVALLLFGVLLGFLLACLELMCLKRSFQLSEMSVWILVVTIVNSVFIFILITTFNSYFFLFIFPIPLIPIAYFVIKAVIYSKLAASYPVVSPYLIIFLSMLFHATITYFAYTGFNIINPTEKNLTTAIREKKNSLLNAMLWISIKEEPTLTYLINEALDKNYEAVRLLIKQGANPRGEYWLQNASDSVRWLMVNWMLTEGVKPTEINTLQSPGIEYLAVSYTEKELMYCIEKGFNPEAYPHIIHVALENQRLKDPAAIDKEEVQILLGKMKVLLDHGADINGDDYLLFKPVFTLLVIKLNMGSVLQFILENGADANAKTVNKINAGHENVLPEGITPLMLAAYLNKSEYVDLLVAHGADKSIKDSSGLSALDYAIRGNATDEVKNRVTL